MVVLALRNLYFHTVKRFQIFDHTGHHLLSYPANVPDRNSNKIKKSEVETGNNEPEVKGIFNRPAGICFSYHPEPSILIADKDNHQIQVSSGRSRDPGYGSGRPRRIFRTYRTISTLGEVASNFISSVQNN